MNGPRLIVPRTPQTWDRRIEWTTWDWGAVPALPPFLLADGSGPLADLMRERGVWDNDVDPPGRTPVAYLDRLRVLSPRTQRTYAYDLL